MGARHKFDQDRTWARPILRRMELDGYLESNEMGEYRLKSKPGGTTSFIKALSTPGVSLADPPSSPWMTWFPTTSNPSSGRWGERPREPKTLRNPWLARVPCKRAR